MYLLVPLVRINELTNPKTYRHDWHLYSLRRTRWNKEGEWSLLELMIMLVLHGSIHNNAHKHSHKPTLTHFFSLILSLSLSISIELFFLPTRPLYHCQTNIIVPPTQSPTLIYDVRRWLSQQLYCTTRYY